MISGRLFIPARVGAKITRYKVFTLAENPALPEQRCKKNPELEEQHLWSNPIDRDSSRLKFRDILWQMYHPCQSSDLGYEVKLLP